MIVQNLARKIISLLISLGLKEREARLYYLLLSRGEKGAGELANLSRIPQSHVYSLLKSMYDRGVIEILEGEWKRYRAVSLATAIEKLTSDGERKLISLKNEGMRIAKQLGERELVEFKPISRSIDVEGRAIEMIQAAKKDILCITSAEVLLKNWEKYLYYFIEARARGVKPRIIVQFDGEKIEDLKSLMENDLYIRFFKIENLAEINVLKMLLIDGEEALIGACRMPAGLTSNFGIWTNNGEILMRLKHEFEALWNKTILV